VVSFAHPVISNNETSISSKAALNTLFIIKSSGLLTYILPLKCA
jgi:hypothetical protein